MAKTTKHTFVCIIGDDFGKIVEFNLERRKPIDFQSGQLLVNGLFKPELRFKKDFTCGTWLVRKEDQLLTLNEDATSSESTYRLIQSDLLPPDYSSSRTFNSITSIYDYDKVDQREFNKLIEFLDPVQDRIIREVAGSFEAYVRMHLTDPIATIRKQNAVLDQIVQGCLIGTEDYRKLIAFYTSDDGLDAAPLIERDLSMVVSRSINRSIFKSAVKLNAKIEKVLFKRFKERKPEFYDELQSVEYLVENDVSAGENFILGEPETYSRFIGLIKKYRHPMIREFLAACKGIAGMKPDRLYAAIEIMRFMHLAYSKNQAVPTPAGVTMTLGKAFEEGGNCSTRAPTLQLGLQEAGIRSRYCRGFLRGSSRRHAWVEADVFDDGTYALILDPNKTNIYVKGNIAAPGMYLYADEKRVEKDYHNKIWRPKIIH